MSVMMNTSRKAQLAKELLAKKMKAKAEAAKARSHEQERAKSEPPMSSASTVVWYWDHDSVRTVLMYDRVKNKVWCNGYELETDESFDDPNAPAGVITFGIFIHEHSVMHQGRICRILTAGEHPDGYGYVLHVNGFLIPEHLSSGVSAVIHSGAEASDVDSPPSYQASVNSRVSSGVQRNPTKIGLPWMLSALRMKKE